MTNPNTKLSSSAPGNMELLDDAALEALGINTPEASDAFTRNLAVADEATQRQARQLRETVAQLSAASPYMDPPARLRDTILLATAPANYQLEEYRKRPEHSSRLLRWSLAAAVLFLVASGIHNNSLKSQLDQKNAQIASITNTASQQQTAMSDLSSMFVNPQSEQVALSQQGKTIGRVLVDPQLHIAFMILPQSAQQPGKTPIFYGPDKDGKKIEYTTRVVYLNDASLQNPSNNNPHNGIAGFDLGNKPYSIGSK